MKIKNNTVYWCKTIELAEQFLQECEKQGVSWGHRKATQFDVWKMISMPVGFRVHRNILTYARIDFFYKHSNEYPHIVEYIPTKQTIVIKTDGNTVTAYMGDKRGVAKCNPADTFDLYIGAKLALDRLFDKENDGVREVKRKAKVGEYIKIVNAWITFGDYQNGDVFKVETVSDIGVWVEHYGKDKQGLSKCTHMSHREYVVLENYKPKK